MGQRLRDWYRYLEQQMHVSLPEDSVLSLAAAPNDRDIPILKEAQAEYAKLQ